MSLKLDALRGLWLTFIQCLTRQEQDEQGSEGEAKVVPD